MNFLAVSAQAAYGLLASIALLIVLMYRLKPKPRRVTVASNFIWRTLETVQRPTLDRWRWWLSLLLALVTGLSIALALTRPQSPGIGGVAQRVVLVLDNSASMAARGSDGTSRWEQALKRARSITLSAGLASEFMVLDILGRSARPEWVPRDIALEKLSKIAVSVIGVARMPPIPTGENIKAFLFTDGVAQLNAEPNVSVESVFSLADNVAITAFDTKPLLSDPTRYQALLQIFNASAGAKQVQLRLTGDNGFALEQQLTIPANAAINRTLDVTGFTAGVLRAEVRTPGDGFELDNLAYNVVAPHHRKRVLLVSAGKGQLAASLGLLPGVALTVIEPARYSAALDFDAYVFNRFAPPEPPRRGALLFHPPPVPWLPNFAPDSAHPVITRWDESHPLAANVSWPDVLLQRAALAKLSRSDTSLVMAKGASEGVLIAAGGAAPRWIATGFAVDESNFAMQSGFPVFLGTALNWLADGVAAEVHGLGRIEIPYANRKVTDLGGRSVATLSIAGDTMFDALRPDVFTVTSNTGTSRVVANVIDAQFSDINRSRFATAPTTSATTHAPRFGFEPWVALIVLGVALLAFEWLAYTRRYTV